MVEIRFSMFYNKRLLIIRTIILFMFTLISLLYMTMVYFNKILNHGGRVDCKNCHQDSILTVNNTDCTDNEFTSSRLVWPEQLPRGDRIIEQMYYVPKGYKYLKTPIKRILIYTGAGAAWEVPKSDQGEFFGCPVSQCWLTLNKSLGPEVDAVIFRHSYSRPKYWRPSNQIWILFNTEAPYSTDVVSDANVFNWTANYRWDSDVPRPYGYFMKNNPPLPQNGEKNYAEHKTKKVAWFVSNCNPNSNRMIYVQELAKHISVDVYGGCGTLECPQTQGEKCFEMLKNDYKFYLSFENSHCIYYVTEKLFLNALSVLPIVMGPNRSDYELMAPKNSFIHVDDFESPKQLADYLHLLDDDDRLYNNYFQWKGSGTIIHDTGFYCRLCAMLHDTERASRHYEDVNKWWRGPGTCHR
ncbi:glycoprotein 3-alpha-L-fucosyltransferase A-like isoform X1 [Rhopalosiphum maidis]|uniref:glycoprotein 3-alpha-L-fucosyltransferase A-like isoform X1 n=1 Tax=Rhopalosiphum maidis TaxID=43146 RepID=UPI000F003E50|nr:glycoprotein 3-alpha-L-fucosyltransferase A-like isoform X1 [Rhopalosiphum maidis]